MSDLKQKILSAVQGDMADIEAALMDNLNPHFELVRQVAGHLLFAGGKRLRPLLMMLSARLCGYNDGDSAGFASIFEYMHAASLLHDDVVDGGKLRRGKPVANEVWDPPTAVLTGDFLLSRSLAVAATTGRLGVIQAIVDIAEMMSQGEIQQLARKGDPTLSENEYLEVIRCKTAVLFQGACRTGALLGNAPDEKREAVANYGHHCGMAFQIADDLIDYTQDAGTLGKNPGADLREGKMTLPVIYTIQRATRDDARWIRSMVERQDFSEIEFRRLVDTMEAYGGIRDARRLAVDQIEAAKEALAVFSASKERELLYDIADYALLRKA
jgi:octaprenyl-diphosphate synthase